MGAGRLWRRRWGGWRGGENRGGGRDAGLGKRRWRGTAVPATARPRRCPLGSPSCTHLGASSSGSRAPFRIFLPALPLRLQRPRIPLAPAGSARSIFTSWDARGHAPSSLSLAMAHASHSLIGGGH